VLEGRAIQIHIGSGIPTPVRRIVELIVECVRATVGRRRFGELHVRALEQEVDVDETARVLGWRATTGLEEGLRRTVAWYRKV
jgi:UDP-glucose 4-epimerase